MQLTSVLRETRYLLTRQEQGYSENVPESAANIFLKEENLRKLVTTLDVTVEWYNKVKRTTLPVEFPLIAGQLADVDVLLSQAEKSLNWNTEGASHFIFLF